MSRMLSKMNLISVAQQLPKEDIETIQGYVEMIEEENQEYKEVIDKAIDLIEKSVTTDIGIDSNNNIIHYHQLTEDETSELLDILNEVE